MKKTLTALSFISALFIPVLAVAGPGEAEYTYKNGEKIRTAYFDDHTSLFSDEKGRPVLLINPKDDKDISHNYFTEYNVGKKGLVIINDSNARTIINEVTGGNRSNLRGETRIIGRKAHVLIVNPHGVTCRKCTSFNTASFVLSNNLSLVGKNNPPQHSVPEIKNTKPQLPDRITLISTRLTIAGQP